MLRPTYNRATISKLSKSERIDILKIFASILPREKAFEKISEKYEILSKRMAKDYCYKAMRGGIDRNLVKLVAKEDKNKYKFLRKLRYGDNIHPSGDGRVCGFVIEIDDDSVHLKTEKSNSNSSATFEQFGYLKSLLICEYCDKLIESPINLPCGRTICKTHIDEMVNKTEQNNSFLKCKLCKNQHSYPVEGFLINKAIESLLSSKIGKGFKDSKQAVEKLKANIADLEKINKNSLPYINDIFSKIESEINKDRLFMVNRIERNYTDLKRILHDERNKSELAKKLFEFTNEIESFAKKKNELEEKLGDSEERVIELVKDEAEQAAQQVQFLLANIKKSILEYQSTRYETLDKSNISKNLLGSLSLG